MTIHGFSPIVVDDGDDRTTGEYGTEGFRPSSSDGRRIDS